MAPLPNRTPFTSWPLCLCASVAPSASSSSPFHRHRRGTAEFELILSVVVLSTILMLSIGAMRVGMARMETARNAQFEAMKDAITAQSPQYTGDPRLQPIGGVGEVRPGFPNRTHVPRPTADVTVQDGNNGTLPPITVGGSAGLASPAWTYWGYPLGSEDRDASENWVRGYVTESHGDIVAPLRLAPAWEP